METFESDRKSVTAAELVRAFPQCRDMASKQPLMITNHGRNTAVLLGIEQFEELAAQGQRNASVAETGSSDIRELAEWLDDAVLICDRDLTIAFANRVADAVCRKPRGSLTGKPLLEALPEVAGTMVEVHLRRTLVGSEPSAADLPSPFTAGAWLRAQTFPIGEQITFTFRDITEEVARHRFADVKNALLEAMNCHGQIGYVRVSVRGTIERVDLPFCEMLGLTEERLLNLPVADLVALRNRAEFRSTLDRVIRSTASICLNSEFLSNRGTNLPMRIAIAPLHGAYGAEGAILLMTNEAPDQSPA